MYDWKSRDKHTLNKGTLIFINKYPDPDDMNHRARIQGHTDGDEMYYVGNIRMRPGGSMQGVKMHISEFTVAS